VKPRFFRSPDELRRWLEKNGTTQGELWVGFHNRRSGRAGLAYKQALDEALCFGWIDGVRHNVDDGRYTIRFTPRRARSIWSLVNIERMKELIALDRVTPAGREAFARRDPRRSGVYSFERAAASLGPAFERRFRANADAWAYFQSQPPWYRRTSTYWVTSAKKEETRLRRLETLIARSAEGLPIKELDRRPADVKRGGGKA
jgi:uncharacterized protein YdeI (YjbR/CyaY-like superfamily)